MQDLPLALWGHWNPIRHAHDKYSPHCRFYLGGSQLSNQCSHVVGASHRFNFRLFYLNMDDPSLPEVSHALTGIAAVSINSVTLHALLHVAVPPEPSQG